jgi:uroporphyrinogen III methyltransferase/synthase
MKSVKCFLVGGGPGDPGLFTLKGFELLKRADSVVYDSLSSPDLLEFTKSDCRCIFVGKRSGRHSKTQREIEKILVDECRRLSDEAKKTDEEPHRIRVVIRLKGGDPFIFGRGSEEASALKAAGIPFEVVPGVSSVYSVPAYAGIPLTARGYSTGFSAMTGHRSDESEPVPVSCQDTSVYLMGIGNIDRIVKAYRDKGTPDDTPIAVIQKGTTHSQKTVIATLGTIVEKLREQPVETPGIIVIGRVVSLKSECEWFEVSPFFGKKVVVTSSLEKASVLTKLLEEEGFSVVSCPVTRIEALNEHEKEMMDILKGEPQSIIIFTSSFTVDRFFQVLKANSADMRIASRSRIAAIGRGTMTALERYHVAVDHVPEDYSQEGLLALLQKEKSALHSALIPRAESARPVLEEALKELGCKVMVVPLYRSVPNNPDTDITGAEVVIFTSSSSAVNFLDWAAIPGSAKVVAIGPVTQNTLREHGVQVDRVAAVASYTAVVEAVKQIVER